MEIFSEPWGTIEGEKIDLFTLKDDIVVKLTNYGGTIVSINAPDASGLMGDVVLGFDTLEGYVGTKFYHGATIGRYANRIAGGRFELDDVEHKLAKNDPPNHLHGGLKGFDKVIWAPEVLDDGIRLHYKSGDGEEGYPGEIYVSVSFVVEGDSLSVGYIAETSKSTVMNLTNHTYFNLKGEGDILSHRLWVDSDSYTPINERLIPLGHHESVEGSPFDFREEQGVGDRITDDHLQLQRGGGYDHNYVLNHIGNPQIMVTEPELGRVLEISTTMPGVQFYTGNFLDGLEKGRNGPIRKRSGLCLETQYFPDSPNQPSFPSTVLRPGEKYIEKTVYRFTTVG